MSTTPLSQKVIDSIVTLKAYTPGLSIEEIQERYQCEKIIKMASNENALGSSPLVQERLNKAISNVFRYPQSHNPRIVQALAQKHMVEASCIVVGNGSGELIDMLIRVCCNPKQDNIVCFHPCFSLYAVQAQICGVELRQAPLNADFSQPFDTLLTLINTQTRLVFITTPDNPSGYCPQAKDVLALAKALPPQCLLVIDEAYMDFTDESTYSLLAQGIFCENVVFLRTFSKSYGLAGIRLGYGIFPAGLAEYLKRAHMPFSVNILAEEAGLAALEDKDFYAQSLATVRAGRKQLINGLQALNCFVIPSHANFIMFSLPHGKDVGGIFEALLHKGFILRPLKSYGLPNFIRITVGTEHENSEFLTTFAHLLHM